MTPCLIESHHAGLFSLLNNVLMWMHERPVEHVDWTNTLYSEDGKNLWDDLFQSQPGEGPIDSLERVGVHPDQWLTYRNVSKLYQADSGWRHRANAHWSKLAVNENIQKAALIDSLDLELGYIAAIVRVHGHAGEQINETSQTLDEYAFAIDQEREPDDKVYVMSSDNESLQWLSDRFPVVYEPHTKRAATRGSDDAHLSSKQTPVDAALVLKEALIVSESFALIHPVSNIATFCLYANPSLKSVYLP